MPLIARYTVNGMHVDAMCKTVCIHVENRWERRDAGKYPWRFRVALFTAKMNMQQTKKTTGRRDRIAAQNATISRRGMPLVTYPVDHPGRHEALRSVLAVLRPLP